MEAWYEITVRPLKNGLETLGRRVALNAIVPLRIRFPGIRAFTTANAVTITRLGLVIPIAVGAVYFQKWAFWLFIAAALSDLLDGWIARYDGPTRLGTFLDSVSDKVLTLPLLVIFWMRGFFPFWIMIAVGLLITVDLGNLCANIVNFAKGRIVAAKGEKRRFSTGAGQIKFWAICIGIGAFLVAEVSLSDHAGLYWFGCCALLVALFFAVLSFTNKIA